MVHDMDGSPEELLTSPQVGVELGVSARTVHRWMEAGDLHSAHKLRGPNGAFLFRRSEIDAFKKRQANTAASA